MTSEPKPNQQSGAADESVGDMARVRSRRNFLKGTSLALPAAMTLTPGTVQALASVTCGQKALDSNLTAPVWIADGADDGLYRFDVDVHDKLVPGVDGQGNPIMVPNGTPTYFIDTVQGVWRDSTGGITDPQPPEDLGGPVAIKRAIVHINAVDGAPVACGSGSNPPNAIITSAAGACMASLAAHNL